MADEDEVEQTPHGGTRIRARAPQRRPEVRFDPGQADEPDESDEPPLQGGVDPNRARPGAGRVAIPEPPVPPTDASVAASQPDLPLVDTRALAEQIRERTRGLLERVRSIEPPPAILGRDGDGGTASGDRSLDRSRTGDRPPVPPMDAHRAPEPSVPAAGTDGPSEASTPPEGFRLLRYGPPSPETDPEPGEPEPSGIDLPSAAIGRPPAPPASFDLQATPAPSEEGAAPGEERGDADAGSDEGMLARLRSRLPLGRTGGAESETDDEPLATDEGPDEPPEPQPSSEGALGRPPAPPASTRDEESMVAVSDEEDEPSDESEESAGFLSRMKDRFSRGDDAVGEPAADDAPAETPADEDASDGDSEAETGEDDAGFFSRMRDRFSSDEADEPAEEDADDDEVLEGETVEPDEEPLEADEETAEEDLDEDTAEEEADDEVPDDEPVEEDVDGDGIPEEETVEPIDAELEADEGTEDGVAVDEGDADEVEDRAPEEEEGAGKPEPAEPEEPRLAAELPDEPDEVDEPERRVEPDQARPHQPDERGAPEPATHEGDRVPAVPAGAPSQPAHGEESGADDGDAADADERGDDEVDERDPEELHEDVDDVLERYRQRPPRLLRGSGGS